MPPIAPPRDVAIYEKPGVSARRLQMAVGCAGASLSLVLIAAFECSGGLVFAVPVLLSSLAGLAVTASEWERRGKPAILLSRDGLTMPSVVVQTIPWATMKGATRFEGLLGARLALVFDHDRIREVTGRGNKREVPKTLLDVTLVPGRYDIEMDVLQKLIAERIAEAPPWRGGLVNVQRRSPSAVALPVLILALVASFALHMGFHHLRDSRLRARIAAPIYPEDEERRIATAPRDILAHPRDTRIRYAYADALVREGKLAKAQAELEAALKDIDASRVMAAIDGGRIRDVGLDLIGRSKILLSVILARRGELERARQIAAESCPDVPNSQMPTLAKLDLCHYGGKSVGR